MGKSCNFSWSQVGKKMSRKILIVRSTNQSMANNIAHTKSSPIVKEHYDIGAPTLIFRHFFIFRPLARHIEVTIASFAAQFLV